MKLTKAQRHRIYKEALKNIVAGHGLCHHLQLAIKLLYNVYISYSDLRDHLPEFSNKRPNGSILFWFPISEEGLRERKKVLRACIRETAPKKRK